jgi:hypothetical protein
LLPKSGNAFNTAIRHLNNVKLPDMAKVYSGLRKAIIESKLVLLTSAPSSIPLEQPLYMGSVNFSGPMWETMLPQTPYAFADYGGEDQLPYDWHFE